MVLVVSLLHPSFRAGCTQANLQTILDQQETLPIQLVQIDDGFEIQVGDWFTFKPEFPNGVEPLAEEITAKD